jgi:hypothetical protein
MIMNSYKKWIDSHEDYFDVKRFQIMIDYGDYLFS